VFAEVKQRKRTAQPNKTQSSEQEPHMATVRQPLTNIGTGDGVPKVFLASLLTFSINRIAFRRVGNENVQPHVHVSLVLLLSLSTIPQATRCNEKDVPWADIVSFP